MCAMIACKFCVVITWFVLFWLVADANVDDMLHYYETMHTTQVVSSRSRRSLNGRYRNRYMKDVKFTTLGRYFHLHLNLEQNLLSPDFKVYAINEANQRRRVSVNKNIFYHGTLFGEENSNVLAYWEDGDKLSATISTKDDVYHIEPSWRHLPESNNYSMITYRDSDLKIPDDFGKKFCGAIKVDQSAEEENDEVFIEQELSNRRSRHRRRTGGPILNTCPLLLVADWKFYAKIGQRSMQRTSSYLMNLIQRVNYIYMNTDFGKGYINMGFEIKQIMIHEGATLNEGEHYNSKKEDWVTQRLLQVFSRNPEYKNFCLAHLFTHQSFQDGVLGLAYVGSRSRSARGGICSPVHFSHEDGRDLFINTGWSSAQNRYGNSLLTRVFHLVTTHELGHSWGSEHDPPTRECVPLAKDGGRYVMYMHSVSGLARNNKLLSNCSKRSIRLVLAGKSPLCFTRRIGKYCGNGLVERGEDCDGGISMLQGNDQCCEQNCEFKRHAVCSDLNQPCCLNCALAPPTVVCHPEQLLKCMESSNCTGRSASCPPPSLKTDGTPCLNRGHCQRGRCRSLCESHLLTSCVCDDSAANYCHWCCMSSVGENRSCRPFTMPGNPQPLLLPPGTPCTLGYCNELGTCLQQRQNLIVRLWWIIENLNPSSMAQFVKSNIVCAVVLSTLLVWIPVSCIVSYRDRINEQEELSTLSWMCSDNTLLIHPLADITMRRSSGKVHHRSSAKIG